MHRLGAGFYGSTIRASALDLRKRRAHAAHLVPSPLFFACGARAQDFLERRLQTQVFKLGLAKSIHHARVLIKQRHIRVGKQIVDVPQFMVRTDSQKHIDFSLSSPFGGGRPGRVKRKAMAAKSGGGGAAAEEAEDDE